MTVRSMGDAARPLHGPAVWLRPNGIAVALVLVGIAITLVVAVIGVRESLAWPKRSIVVVADDGTESTVAPSSTSGVITIRSPGGIRIRSRPPMLAELATSDPGWMAATLGFFTTPLLFWWWRRSAARHGRVLGLLSTAAIGAGVLILLRRPMRGWSANEGQALGLVAVSACYVVAFVVADTPRERDPA